MPPTNGSTFERFEALMRKRPRSETPPPSSSPTPGLTLTDDTQDRNQKRARRNSPVSKLDLPQSTGPLALPSTSPSTATSVVTVECQQSALPNAEISTIIAHTTILNRDDELPAPRPLDSSDYEEFSATVATLAVRQITLKPSITLISTFYKLDEVLISTSSEDDSFESALKRGLDGFLHPFGLPRDRHGATIDAFAGLSRQQQKLRGLEACMDDLIEGVTPENAIQSTLLKVEDDVEDLREFLKGTR
ncbi:hypothetical protein VKT23_019321 [Stygiomarasmius scandens]|uniref:Uncharacterized protein n=1 Tax=Marasmiellus scandens TaxID=2682957 RepID=A0ABR1IPS4_9AGAR